MPKRFDCEDEPNDFMEMPCRCDCGKWFDLNDGHGSERHPSKVICNECSEVEQREIEREEEIQEWHDQLADAELTVKEATAELMKLGVLPAQSEDELYKMVISTVFVMIDQGKTPLDMITELKANYIITKR